MVKSLLAYLLIATILAGNFTPFIIYAGFKVNQRYIATVLCENRDKPVLKCEGKCVLSKKIKQAEEKENSREGKLVKSRFLDAFTHEQIVCNFPLRLIDVYYSLAGHSDLPSYSADLFHPPKEAILS
jgi:hypothetical protein